MSFESFRVELRGGSSTFQQADEAVRLLRNAVVDRESIASSGSTHYTVEDGRHVIEVEVARSPVCVSCRFTLSHPPSVDTAFLNLIRELMMPLGMNAYVCDDVPELPPDGFPIGQLDAFAELVGRTISTRRTEWVANFGPEQFSASTAELHERSILSKCVSVA